MISTMPTESTPGCLLKTGDTIKLGRVKFYVKEIRGESSEESESLAACFTDATTEPDLQLPD